MVSGEDFPNKINPLVKSSHLLGHEVALLGHEIRKADEAVRNVERSLPPLAEQVGCSGDTVGKPRGKTGKFVFF